MTYHNPFRQTAALDEVLLDVFPVSAHGTDSGLSFKECFGLVV